MYQDANPIVKMCMQWQKQEGVSRRHELPLNPILKVELFDVWNIDFMGPFCEFPWEKIHLGCCLLCLQIGRGGGLA